MKTVLAPLDFSPLSASVVKAAVALTRAIEGRLVLLHVVQPPVITSEYGAVMVNIQEIISVSEASAQKQLEQRTKRLAKAGLAISSSLLTGAPVKCILAEAQSVKAAYIVIGSHGHNALYDLLVGSTAAGVIKRSPCPVLVVPPVKAKLKK